MKTTLRQLIGQQKYKLELQATCVEDSLGIPLFALS